VLLLAGLRLADMLMMESVLPPQPLSLNSFFPVYW